MIVTFISECQKKSLALTRKVLDAYAHRIGRRTWQAVMTEQGVEAVHSRLTKTARKSTAVSCHRIRGTRRTELLWIVGNRRRFDHTGNVPVNRTGQDILRQYDENDWRYLSLLKSIVGVAALWHDFGKAWKPFQQALKESFPVPERKRDPVRHEWVSALLFISFAKDRIDSDWLSEMAGLRDQSAEQRKKRSKNWIEQAKQFAIENPAPLDACKSPLVRWMAWLIVSHHRLPALATSLSPPEVAISYAELLPQIDVGCGYEKHGALPLDFAKHWKFEHGLPIESLPWCKAAARWAGRLNDELNLFGPAKLAELQQCQRSLLTIGRTMLMLGDHEYSSKPAEKNWSRRSDYPPVANTYRNTIVDPSTHTALHVKGSPRQTLDDHLVNVTRSAVDAVHLLPAFETSLSRAVDVRSVRKPAPKSFAWQNNAVGKIRQSVASLPNERCGFFAVNMASTGCGKTFANAKIMDATDPRGMRYNLALGLRTLTLQTGSEYRDRLGLGETDLAVMIGSAAIAELHESPGSNDQAIGIKGRGLLEWEDHFGSEDESSLGTGIDFDAEDVIPDDAISTFVSDPKRRQLLKAPVLVCTIDHLMPAVESTRSGHQILPLLRLLSSDLVIDEVDDFDLSDMPAICRLVHLAAMLGRRVMISSATITPSIATGLFRSYRSGFEQFKLFRNRRDPIRCVWVDEFRTTVEVLHETTNFDERHEKFVSGRAKKLASLPVVRRKVSIRSIEPAVHPTSSDADDIPAATNEMERRRYDWQSTAIDAAMKLHRTHCQVDEETDKRVSIGVIRMANVDPCIDLATMLAQRQSTMVSGIDVRVLCYHARQVLLIRSETERYLDRLLKRTEQRTPWTDPVIRDHLRSSDSDDVTFIVVASPVVEVGRDHDYDWAVLEPSSMRSMIQMGGRVLRHREIANSIGQPNVAVMNQNFRDAVYQQDIVFNRPGYEGGSTNRGAGYQLTTHQLCDLVDVASLAERLDSTPRILTPPSTVLPTADFSCLEHQVLSNVLVSANHRPAFNHGWCQCDYYLTDLSQRDSPFRQSSPDTEFHLHVVDGDQLQFWRTNPRTGRCDYPRGTLAETISLTNEDASGSSCWWSNFDYAELIQRQCERMDRGVWWACERYGAIRVMDQEGEVRFQWSPLTGAARLPRMS